VIPVGGVFTTYRVEPEGTVATKVQSVHTGEARADVEAEGTGLPLGYVGTGEAAWLPSAFEYVDAVLEGLGVADLSALDMSDGDGLDLAFDSPPRRAATFWPRTFLPRISCVEITL